MIACPIVVDDGFILVGYGGHVIGLVAHLCDDAEGGGISAVGTGPSAAGEVFVGNGDFVSLPAGAGAGHDDNFHGGLDLLGSG